MYRIFKNISNFNVFLYHIIDSHTVPLNIKEKNFEKKNVT